MQFPSSCPTENRPPLQKCMKVPSTSTRVLEGPQTPSSLTWEPQSRLAFGHHRRVCWPSGLWPLDITILQCAASLAAGGYDQPCELIKSLSSIEFGPLLDSKTLCDSFNRKGPHLYFWRGRGGVCGATTRTEPYPVKCLFDL